MLRGDLVKLFFEDSRVNRWCRSTRESFRSHLSAGRSDGMDTITLHAVASPFSLRFARDTGVSPSPGGEVGFEEGALRVYSGNDTWCASNSAPPAFAVLRPAGGLSPRPGGDATEQPQRQSSPRRLIKHTAERQVTEGSEENQDLHFRFTQTLFISLVSFCCLSNCSGSPESVRGCNEFTGVTRLRSASTWQARPPFGRTRPVASLPLQDHQSTLAAGELACFRSRVPRLNGSN